MVEGVGGVGVSTRAKISSGDNNQVLTIPVWRREEEGCDWTVID